MRSTDFTFQTGNGIHIYVRKFVPDAGGAKGIILISHGVSEHSARYIRFAEALTHNGYTVYAHDQRGHGKTAGEPSVIHLNPGDFNGMSDDIEQLRAIAVKENPGLPVFLFGHSLGTVISRKYLQKYGGSALKGVVLCGPVAMSPALMPTIEKRVAGLMQEHGGSYVDVETVNILFGTFNEKIEPERTSCDWLSRDTAEVDKYIADPCSGQPQTVGFYHEFASTFNVEDPVEIAKIQKELPILFIAGDHDPAGTYIKGVDRVIADYQAAGLSKVELYAYPGARHELLNETNREEVTADVIRWFDSHL